MYSKNGGLNYLKILKDQLSAVLSVYLAHALVLSERQLKASASTSSDLRNCSSSRAQKVVL